MAYYTIVSNNTLIITDLIMLLSYRAATKLELLKGAKSLRNKVVNN